MIEVRWHGRGGQGVVTSSEILAKSALLEGKYIQHFPEFGPERRGAPVRAFTRISDGPIDLHYGIYNPDIVVVIDPTLLSNIDYIIAGMEKNSILVVNATKINPELVKIVKESQFQLFYVDAYTIALETFGRSFYNTPMLGALAKATKLVSLGSILKIVDERFSGEIAEKNKTAIRRAYEEVKKYE